VLVKGDRERLQRLLDFAIAAHLPEVPRGRGDETGESFDEGPYWFLPVYALDFVAAYFDHTGLYAFGQQPRAMLWNLTRLAERLGIGPRRREYARYPYAARAVPLRGRPEDLFEEIEQAMRS
jgi:uncharacterized protein YdiU (UPF0061 family)